MKIKVKYFFSSKPLLLFIFFLSGLTISAQSIVQKHGRLRVSGNHVVDKNNEPLSLAGNSLFWSNAGDTSDFYEAETVTHLVNNWNSSIVRVAMGVKESWDFGNGYIDSPTLQKNKIRKVIDAAIAKGIYVIIDWHTHEAEKHTNEAADFFAEMAKLYGDKPNVIYEVYNEPINQSWSQVKNYSNTVIAAIRAEDPDNLIIVGSPNWSQDVDVAANDPINDSNTAYTLHFYAGTHTQFLRDKATTAMNRGAAIFVTEWGATQATGDGAADRQETEKWMKFLKDNGISHANWSVADKDEGSAVVSPDKGIQGLKNNELTPNGLFIQEIIKNWSEDDTGGNGGGTSNCSFETPISIGIGAINGISYTNVHVVGTGGPNFNNFKSIAINWNPQYNGLYQFAISTNNGTPNWYVDFRNTMSYQLQNASPEITLNNTGFSGLDGSYWVTKDGDNFVLVSKTKDFTLYFNNSNQAPQCSDRKSDTTNKPDLSNIKIYPNPTNGLLNLSGLTTNAFNITISDMQGKKIITKIMSNESSLIDVSDLRVGTYVMVVKNNSTKKSILFTKL